MPWRLLVVRVVTGRAVRRDRAVGARCVATDALCAAVSARQREDPVVEGSVEPRRYGVTLRAFHRETAGNVAGRLLIVRVVTGCAIGRDRLVSACGVTGDALCAAVTSR